MRTLSITIPGEPCPKGRPRFSRRSGRAFTPAKTQAAEQSLAGRALSELRAMGHAAPLEGPLELAALFVLPVPPSWPRWKQDAARLGTWLPTGRPDADNYAKLLLDALNGVLFLDDGQVVRLDVSKRYGVTPQTVVDVRELEQAARGA